MLVAIHCALFCRKNNPFADIHDVALLIGKLKEKNLKLICLPFLSSTFEEPASMAIITTKQNLKIAIFF